MTYRKGRWHCDGEACNESRRHLPRNWYAIQVKGEVRTYCTTCLSSLYRKLARTG